MATKKTQPTPIDSSTTIDLPAMKRADRRRAERECEYNRRDLRNMGLVSGLAIALLYTSLWLVSVIVS